jgi:hypothetical protein
MRAVSDCACSGFYASTHVNALSFRLFGSLSRIFCASSQVGGEGEGESVKFNHTNSLHHLEGIMKVLKNAEAVFLAAAALATFATYASADVPTQRVAAPVAVKAAAAGQPQMQVVIIKGKRLTAAEKAKLL